MAFFETVDDLTIAERHIKELRNLEEQEAKGVLRRYREIRRDLRDRLDSLPSDSFTAQQLRGVIVQIDQALAEMGRVFLDDFGPAAQKAAEKSVRDLESEIEKFSEVFTGAIQPINLDAQVIGNDTNNFLFNRYEASIESYTEGVRGELARQLSQGVAEQISFAQAVRRLSQIMIAEEFKLLRIARTELHNVYNLAKIEGMRRTKDQFIPDLKKALIHPMDSRTADDSKKLARLDPVVGIEQKFKFTFNGQQREFFAPPDRPNDRAILIPFRDAWNE